jgi:hypothetical protein
MVMERISEERRFLLCARPVDVSHAKLAVWRSRTAYASVAASHPKNARARRNREFQAEKDEKAP